MKFILPVLFAVFSPFAFSQEAEDTAHAEATAKLVEIMNMKEEMQTGFQSSMSAMMQPLVDQLQLDEQQAKELHQVFTDWWEADIDQEKMLGAFKEFYSEAFTTEELEELAAFYQTPLGRKTLELMPELTQKGMAVGVEEAQKKQGALQKRIEEFMARIEAEKQQEEEQDEDGDE